MAADSGTRIIGIDPGLNATGYAILEAAGRNGPAIVEAGVIRGGHGDLENRLQEIHQGVSDLLAAFPSQSMAIEELYTHYERPRTAILMGHARGVICLAASQAGVPVAHYAATRVKKTLTGHGRAPKSQMQEAVCREFRLKQPPRPADVADALAIALCHYYATVASGARRAGLV
jgi:crossover junction endodeoxyribonuclease RuvC